MKKAKKMSMESQTWKYTRENSQETGVITVRTPFNKPSRMLFMKLSTKTGAKADYRDTMGVMMGNVVLTILNIINL